MANQITNRLKEPEKEKKQKMPKIDLKIGKTVKGVLGGEVLEKPAIKFYPFLLFITFLAFIYIANNYYFESKTRQINHLYAELKEINFEYINGQSKLEELSKQSVIAKKLEKTRIKESTKPINVIRLRKENK
jgi:hypothetical protein